MKPTDDMAFETWFAAHHPKAPTPKLQPAYDHIRDWARRAWRECRERMEKSRTGILPVQSSTTDRQDACPTL